MQTVEQLGFSLISPRRTQVFDHESQSICVLPKETCFVSRPQPEEPEPPTTTKIQPPPVLAPEGKLFPKRGGLPSSPGPAPNIEIPAPLILTPEDAFLLEQHKTKGHLPQGTF